MKIVIIVIVAITIVYLLYRKSVEHFDLHAIITPQCDVQTYSYKSPRMDGRRDCTLIPCPETMRPGVTCWSCSCYH
jgi:hypothetical protein